MHGAFYAIAEPLVGTNFLCYIFFGFRSGRGERNACVMEMVFKDVKLSSMEDAGTDIWYTFNLRIHHTYVVKLTILYSLHDSS